MKSDVYTGTGGVTLSRSPHGERGLKFYMLNLVTIILVSLSSRRAWIEITCYVVLDDVSDGRSPHGERGLK